MSILTDERTSSSSSSSPTRPWVYDVFLSFRSEETRYSFVSHLYNALCRVGFFTFVDNDLLPRGENISAELLKVIESSMVSIIVISENYASSSWCLAELVKIFECEKNGQLVLPVFFRVKPLEIEEKFERYLAKHEAELDDVEMVQRWRAALTKAVNFPGSLYNDGQTEREIITKIIEILNGQVIHLERKRALHWSISLHPEEDQPALHWPIMHPEEDWPALRRPTMHPEEDQPALHRPIMHPEEDQPTLHRPTMHLEKDHGRPMHPEGHNPAVWVYGVNCASVVGIYSDLRLKGSGFVWDNMGHIVTNWHVIQNASDFRVTLFDNSACDAKVVGFCKNKDVAVLHAEELEGRVKPISICHFADLLVGQLVFSIGSPFGLDQNMTTSIISGLCREIASPANGRPIRDVIKIDCAINPANSGGPLFDSAGSLIGINTAITTTSDALCGVGFSISIHSVRGIIDQLVRDGKVLHPHLGITLSSVSLLDGSDWLLVIDVAVDGPAAKAGLQKTDHHACILGDIIISVNDKKVTNNNDLFKILDRCKEGDKVTVGVLRGGHKKNISVTLELNPDESESDVMLGTRNVFKC